MRETVHALLGLPKYRCIVAGCGAPTDQRHHASYRAPERWGHQRFAICDRHHADLSRLWRNIDRSQIGLALFTLNFVVDPQGTALDAIALMPIKPSLSFGDLATREGEYWRAWEAWERNIATFDEASWEDRDAA